MRRKRSRGAAPPFKRRPVADAVGRAFGHRSALVWLDKRHRPIFIGAFNHENEAASDQDILDFLARVDDAMDEAGGLPQ